MHYVAYIIFVYFLLRVGSVPSGFKIKSITLARDNEYPFIVRLERQITIAFLGRTQAEENVHICTCVALTPSWTLTAGHCIASVGPAKDITDNLRIKSVVRYGSANSTTADVISTIIHPSFEDSKLKMQNNIGLLRTDMIRLKQYAHVSALDINTLGGQYVILAGYVNTNSSPRISADTMKRKPLQLLNVVVVRYDTNDPTTLPGECVARTCTPWTTTSSCPEDSGGPMLHSTGVVGINTISLENVKLCSAVDKNLLTGMRIITPIEPHVVWITNNIKKNEVFFNKTS